MSEIVVHIGFDKTGTKAIQRFLYEHTEQLLKHNLVYVCPKRPTFPYMAINHEVLVSMFLKPELVPKETASAYNSIGNARLFASEWANAFRTRRIQKGSSLIISSEAFYSLPLTGVKSLHGAVNWLAAATQLDHRTRIIAYVSEPASRYRRASSQLLVTGNRVHRPSDQPVRKFIERYIQVFGRANVFVRVYDLHQLTRQDVVDDFLNLLRPGLMTGRNSERVDENRSPSSEALLLVNVLRDMGFSDKVNFQDLVCEAIIFDRAVGSAKVAALTEPVAEFLAGSSADYDWLAGEFGISFSGPLNRQDKGRFRVDEPLSISDIFIVDPARYAALASFFVKSTHVLKTAGLAEADLLRESAVRAPCTRD